MKPVDQTRFGADGNCTAACLASLLGVPIESVPAFQNEADTTREMNDWLVQFGLYAVTFSCGVVNGEPWHPSGYYILGGASSGGPHDVIARGADIVHDPNPNRAGLIRRETITLLVPLDPGVRR